MPLFLSEIPPEILREIAEFLRIRPDVQNLALTSKLFIDCCLPVS